jgi:hypothetical protein
LHVLKQEKLGRKQSRFNFQNKNLFVHHMFHKLSLPRERATFRDFKKHCFRKYPFLEAPFDRIGSELSWCDRLDMEHYIATQCFRLQVDRPTFRDYFPATSGHVVNVNEHLKSSTNVADNSWEEAEDY